MSQAKEFYEANKTNVVNVPRPKHPEDKSGWDGVHAATQARFVADDVLVMPLWDVFDFAEKFAKLREDAGWNAALEALEDEIDAWIEKNGRPDNFNELDARIDSLRK
ncbi:MAG TPA: hypothetical protein VFA74_05690 [Terriglobales bacterium]|nr:hypothetical protein [Terriglobales bacterium]